MTEQRRQENKGIGLNPEAKKQMKLVIAAIRSADAEEERLIEEYRREGDDLAIEVSKTRRSGYDDMLALAEWVTGEQIEPNFDRAQQIRALIAKGQQRFTDAKLIVKNYPGLAQKGGQK